MGILLSAWSSIISTSTRTQSFPIQMCSVIYFSMPNARGPHALKKPSAVFLHKFVFVPEILLLLAQSYKTFKYVISLKWTKNAIDLQQNFAQWAIALGSIHIRSSLVGPRSPIFFSPNAARAISENAFNYWMACKKGINIVDRSLSQIAGHSIYISAVAKAFL